MKNEIVNIPDFTVDEYYNSSKPYEFLYAFKDDKFLLRQMCEKMKAKAGANLLMHSLLVLRQNNTSKVFLANKKNN